MSFIKRALNNVHARFTTAYTVISMATMHTHSNSYNYDTTTVLTVMAPSDDGWRTFTQSLFAVLNPCNIQSLTFTGGLFFGAWAFLAWKQHQKKAAK